GAHARGGGDVAGSPLRVGDHALGGRLVTGHSDSSGRAWKGGKPPATIRSCPVPVKKRAAFTGVRRVAAAPCVACGGARGVACLLPVVHPGALGSPMSTLSEKAHNLPPTPGVYLFNDASGRVLYVGKAKSLSQRVRNYLAGDLEEPKTRELMSRAADLDTILTDTEAEALLLESTLVRQHRPHYNILLKDDKSFPYVRVSVQEEFPRLSVTRHVKSDGARYLGPYTDVKH